MKNFTKYILQKLLGFRNYLFVFCLFKIKTLHSDKNEKDFLYFPGAHTSRWHCAGYWR